MTPFPPLRVIVLNPGGRDPGQGFPDGAGRPEDPGHPPVNFHAFAACTHGAFLTDVRAALRADPSQPLLLLLRRDLRPGLRALRALREAGRVVAVAFKETGAAQLAAQLARPAVLAGFLEVLQLADAWLAPTPALADVLRAAGGRGVEFLPTPYPVEDPAWDFEVPPEVRRGVFIGTREFGTPSRGHLAAILAARGFDGGVTVVNAEGRRGAKLLAALGFSPQPDAPRRFLPGPLGYADYLRLMAQHRMVFQLDRSAVPGQVAGDALLCRVPCVGGDGAVERLVAPDLAGHGRDPGELAELATALLRDPARAEAAVHAARARARETLSFGVGAARLAGFFARRV